MYMKMGQTAALQETTWRLTNGEDSQGTGQNMPPNYANKWKSPAVMVRVIWKSGVDSSGEGESLGVITVVWREVEAKMACSLILTSQQQRRVISIFNLKTERKLNGRHVMLSTARWKWSRSSLYCTWRWCATQSFSEGSKPRETNNVPRDYL